MVNHSTIFNKIKLIIISLFIAYFASCSTHTNDNLSKTDSCGSSSNSIKIQEAEASENRNINRLKTNKRFALIIGNSNYEANPLINPVNNANAISEELRKIGFVTILKTNSDLHEMRTAIHDFNRLLSINDESVAFFYFAGHTIQHNDNNYLIPINSVRLIHSDDLEYYAINLNNILESIENTRSGINIFVLDASYNNNFLERNTSKGLASVNAPSRTIIAYSTSPNSIAMDGSGPISVYTQELIKSFSTGLNIHEIFRYVRFKVKQATNGIQIPWESSSLTADFYITKSSGSTVCLPNTHDKCQFGKLTIDSNILNNSVLINNKKFGYTPIQIKLEPGTYEINVSKEGYNNYIARVKINGLEDKHLTVYMEKKTPQPSADSIPKFPWPPPRPTSRIVITQELLNNSKFKFLNLSDIEYRLKKGLDACGYIEKSYFIVPDGFAIVTRIEHINEDGSSKEEEKRWSVKIGSERDFTLISYLKALFTANPGYYRIIVFIISPLPFQNSDKKVDSKAAEEWLHAGANTILSDYLSKKPYTPDYQCTALIYEFEKYEHTKEAVFIPDERLSAIIHLKKSNLLDSFDMP